MANALKDGNRVSTMIALSASDGVTTLPVYANVTTNSVKVDDGLGGSDLSGDVDARDENRVLVFMAVSATDGITPVPIYANATGNKLLVRTV